MSQKDLVEEALLQMRNVENVIAENAKGILASTMKEEISQLVKESLSEQDEIELDAMTDVDVDDDSMEVDADELEMDSDDSDMETMDDIEFEDDDETIDLTDASDEEILAIFKRMGDEDGIIVKKDGDDVHIKDTDEDVEYLVKMNEEEEDELEEMEMEMEESELDEKDTDLEAVLDALYAEGEYNEEEMEEEDEIMYEIVMDEEDEMEESSEEEMEESYDEMEESYDEMEEGSEDYNLEEAKMTVKPKGVGMGSPKFKYGKSLPKKGFDDHKKQGPTKMGTGKAKFEFKEGEGETKEGWGSKKHEYKRNKVNGVEKKAGEKDGHYKDYEKTETKEAARTYGFGSKEGRGLRKGITNNRNYNYTDNGVKVESIEAEMKVLREKNEEYRKALNVFREKLNEVAVFNSNLAYATRLFTEHSTTKKEKINILRRFDSAETLKESKQLYKTMKDELSKVETQGLNESVERKINNQASSGSSTSLIESRAYENPQFLRIKDLMAKL
jgi:hypothetical protein